MMTILTPTYNRATTILNLYNSLENQTNSEFEWLIIDDGSTDDTDSLISELAKKTELDIRIIKKENGGKHSALNIGFKEAKHEWVFVVDSDDTLTRDSVEVISKIISYLPPDYNSICILRIYEDGGVIGDEFPDGMQTHHDRVYMNVKGDKADIFRKQVVVGFEFPEYQNENFMAESPLYTWLGANGKTKFVNFKGYVCKYLEGGLSDQSIKNRYRCINSTLFVYKDQYVTYDSRTLNARAAINWWRFKLSRKHLTLDYRMPLKYLPIGLLLYIKDRFKV